MLPEFKKQLLQLPLITTTWTCVQNRYVQEKKTSSLPIRFIISTIEQTISAVHGNIVRPLLDPYHSHRKLLSGDEKNSFFSMFSTF